MRRTNLLILLSFMFLFSFASGDMVGLWRFEEGSGSVAADSTIYGNDGVLIADTEAGDPNVPLPGPTTEPNWITGVYGTALQFCSGTGNYNHVAVPKSDSLKNLTNTWTFAMWIRQDSRATTPGGGGGYPRVLSSPMYEIELGVPSWEYDYFWPYDNAGLQTDIGPTYIDGGGSLGTWYHMAVTFDGTNLKKYIDGSLIYNNGFAGQSLNPGQWDTAGWTNNPLKFASQTWPSKDWFIGALDDVAIFNQALDSTQVVTIKSGDFSGPWTGTPSVTVETDTPITYLWNPTFKNGADTLGLASEEMAENATIWNWDRVVSPGEPNDPNWFGIMNVSGRDGNEFTIEYAGFCTVGDEISQVALGKLAFDDIVYDFKAKVGGVDAVGHVVGVKFYRVDPDDPYGNEVLLKDIKTTITSNEDLYELSTTYEAGASDHNQRFKAVCYVEGSGTRGDAFGVFDYVRIDPNEFLTCQAILDYNNGSSGLANDFNNDCKVNLIDYAVIAKDWQILPTPPEPWDEEPGELLTNPDFYDDLALVPNNLDYVAAEPTGWEFAPATTGEDVAGIQNNENEGYVANRGNQPAGGSVVAYIDPNTVLQQAVDSPTIQSGQTYYATAMVRGSGAYLSMVTMTLESVDDPDSPTTVVELGSDTFVFPDNNAWRQIAAEYTDDGSEAGNYLRLKFEFGPNPFPGSTVSGYAYVGSASITTTKPDTWPRENLLVNGDFEDYSSLPVGTNNNDGYLDLFNYINHWTSDLIPDWDNSSNASGYSGLQCKLWVAPPQPAMGRVSAWFTNTIEQYVPTSMVEDQTYYVDFMACINNSAYVSGKDWPTTDPNMVVDVYWLASGQTDLSGTPNTDYGLITSVQAPIEGPILGDPAYTGNPYTPWLVPKGQFTADSSLAGKEMYVKAYCNNATVVYPTFEEIYLSTEERPDIGAYTCYEQANVYGITSQADLNGDCSVDIDDLALLFAAENWLNYNDPEGL